MFILPLICLVDQGNLPTREAITVYYEEQMMKTSRESGLDYSSHDATVRRREGGGDEEGGHPDTDEEEAGGQTTKEKEEKPKTDPDDEDDPHSEQEPGLGSIGSDPHPETGSEDDPGGLQTTVSPPETEPQADGHNEPGEEPATVQAEDVPEGIVAETSQRSRPKLSRMERVQSLSSLSSEEEKMGRTHRWVAGAVSETHVVVFIYWSSVMILWEVSLAWLS